MYACIQNTELFTFTYGSLVAQLIQDYETDAAVNEQLELMYYDICVYIQFIAKKNKRIFGESPNKSYTNIGIHKPFGWLRFIKKPLIYHIRYLILVLYLNYAWRINRIKIESFFAQIHKSHIEL